MLQKASGESNTRKSFFFIYKKKKKKGRGVHNMEKRIEERSICCV